MVDAENRRRKRPICYYDVLKRFRRKKFIKLFLVLWLTVVLYLYFTLISRETTEKQRARYEQTLRKIMRGSLTDSSRLATYRPLEELILPDTRTLSFYHLPKRRRGALFTELTSANRDTSYPLAPDFTFHLEYDRKCVVLYEDYGPGCVHRVYLFPVLPTHADVLYRMTAADLSSSYVLVDVDGVKKNYSVEQLFRGDQWPFVHPFNTRHKYLASGMGSYTPLCYSRHMKISYFPGDPLPDDLFTMTVNCTSRDLVCPVHIYSAVSRIKLPTDAEVESFAVVEDVYRRRAELVSEMLRNPVNRHPDTARGQCRLHCTDMCRGCRRTLADYRKSGVVSSILLRVYEPNSSRIRPNWNDILLSATFDGHATISDVTLGSLFGFTGSLNEFEAATFGKRQLSCQHDNASVALPSEALTGYFYLPMPFWSSAELILEGSAFLPDWPLTVCYRVETVPNWYGRSETGYLHATKSHFSDNSTGFRQLLSVDGSWGQLVGVAMELDDLLAFPRDTQAAGGLRPVNERWAVLQADPVVYVDGAKSASVLGTGLEDYFSYSHGFHGAENTTYAFVGNHYSSPGRRGQPLSWHCYRLHVLDPIYFTDSIQFIMEGTSREHFQTRQGALSYGDYMKRRGEGRLGHLVLYYASRSSGTLLTDTLHLAVPDSELQHNLTTMPSSRDSGASFSLVNKRYLGACNENATFNFSGRFYKPHDVISFTMATFRHNEGVILRRKFHSPVGQPWNQLARLAVDGVDIGLWLIAMGTVSPEYSVRQEDYTIGPRHSRHKTKLVFTIEPLTEWRDISYHLFSIT